MSRGITGAIERAWSGAPGTIPWTWAFLPLAFLYASGSAVVRARAERTRRRVAGLRVIAVGGLTAGGSGKSSVAAWLASELLARGATPAILLRGHHASRPPDAPYVVPDMDRYPRSEAAARAGDEAAAHRASLPTEISVAAHADRFRSAQLVHAGYGAQIAILDDGWEQPWLRWDELWAVVDPDRPSGNGAPIPAGPLRRSVSSLREASVVALILDESGGTARGGAMERIRGWSGTAEIVRFRRELTSVSPLGARRVGMARDGTPVSAATLPPAGLLSGIGAPERLERFARSEGIRVVSHAAFPDHAIWTATQLETAVESAARKGARVILTTEKDEARWPARARVSLPVLVLRTSLTPLDPVESILARAAGAMAPSGPIG